MDKLETLVYNLSLCKKCKHSTTRNSIVIGEGHIWSNTYIVGECPGPQEDSIGRPFIGPAGKLLKEMLVDIGIDLSRIYLTNIVRCKPSVGLNPAEKETKICSNWIREQLRIVQPKRILSIGRIATAFFLSKRPEDIRITQLSGKKIVLGKFSIFPVVHPSYVLRNNVISKEQYLEHFFNFMCEE
jgi:DNA polymerase